MREDKIDYLGVVTAARGGDEDAYESLYNQTVAKCRALCMKYFDPATAEGRQKTDAAVKETYVRLYDRLQRLSDPGDFPLLGRSVTREVCLRMAKDETVQLQPEAYIAVGEEPDTPELPALVTADECRAEVTNQAALPVDQTSALVLSVLRRLTPAQRLLLVRWNDNDPAAMKDPDTLREAFIGTEKSLMEMEKRHKVRARDYAKSRLAFFNRLLDLYDRYCEAPPAEDESAIPFSAIWEEIRNQFYLKNTMELKLPQEEPANETFGDYLDTAEPDEEDTVPTSEKSVARKRSFLGTWWGRALIGLFIILLVLAAVIATAGQHTSHALEASVQFADFSFLSGVRFNIS